MSRFDKYASNTQIQNKRKTNEYSDTTNTPPGGVSNSVGGMSAETIRNKYGFDFNKKHAAGKGKGIDEDNGAVYHEETGEYIGTISGYDRQQREGLDTDSIGSIKTSKLEKDANKVGKTVSTLNTGSDIAGLASALMDGEKQEEKKDDPLPTFNEATFSPQVQEAIDRAKNYRDRAWSGEAAQEIYGKSKDPLSGYSAGHTSSSGSANAGDQATQSYFNSEKYKIDLRNKRAQSEASQA